MDEEVPVLTGPEAVPVDQPEETDEESENEEVSASTPPIDDESVLSIIARVGGVVTAATTIGELKLLDSLRVLRMLAAVRQDFGKSLTVRDVAECDTAAQLAARIRRAPQEPALRQSFPPPGKAGFRLWTFGWNNCLQWLFQSGQRLDAGLLRAALARLMKRQPALRLRFNERLEVQTHFMEAAGILDLLRSGASMTRSVPTSHVAIAAFQRAVQVCWPRWCTAPAREEIADGILLEVECASENAHATMKRLRKNFKPPFQLALLTHPTPENGKEDASAPQCHLCVMLSHAIADGAAVVPFLHDLSSLCQEHEELDVETSGHRMKRRLRPVPHFGAILEDRLLRSLRGDMTREDAMFLDRRMDFFEGHFPESRCRGYSQTFHVRAPETRQLRRALEANIPGCSVETSLLALVVMSLARIGNKPRVRFTLVHHGRDQPPGAADVVGFFTDFRTMEVPTSRHMSMLGVISFLSAGLRERNWRLPVMLEHLDVLVNIVPSPFREVGSLAQAPAPIPIQDEAPFWQSWGPIMPLMRALELQLEQVGSEAWCVTMFLDEKQYPREKGESFRHAWLQILTDFDKNPFQSVQSE